MKNRLSHKHSIIAYPRKKELRDKDITQSPDNQIDGNRTALLRYIPTDPNEKDPVTKYITMVATALSLDKNTYDLMLFISSKKELDRYKIITLTYRSYRDIMGKEFAMSQDSFYTSIKALLFVQALQKHTDPKKYHVNSMFFTPRQFFPVTLYFTNEPPKM